jgi:hypothetical protein
MAQLTDGLSLDLFGDKELNAFFHDTLRFSQQKSVMITAYRKAARPLVSTIKQNLRSRTKRTGTNNLLKSIGVKPGKGKYPKLLVGSRTFGNYKGFHGHLINLGTELRRRPTKSGASVSTGKIKGNKFFSDAVESQGQNVSNKVGNELLTSLQKMVERNLKRINK